MVKRRVTIYECDICGATDIPEDLEKRNPIPENWSEISGRNNHGCLFDFTICAECEHAIREVIQSRGAING